MEQPRLPRPAVAHRIVVLLQQPQECALGRDVMGLAVPPGIECVVHTQARLHVFMLISV
jgi:hypothetical protein